MTAEDIADFVREKQGGVTFVELMMHFGPSATGNHSIGSPALNIWFWCGMSEGFVNALKDGVQRRLFHGRITTLATYLVDGQVLSLPIARDAQRYKRPHWAPTALYPGDSARPQTPYEPTYGKAQGGAKQGIQHCAPPRTRRSRTQGKEKI